MTLYARVLWRIVRPVLWLAANYAPFVFALAYSAVHTNGGSGLFWYMLGLSAIIPGIPIGTGAAASSMEWYSDPVFEHEFVPPLGLLWMIVIAIQRRLSKIAQEEREAMQEDRVGLLRPVEEEPPP